MKIPPFEQPSVLDDAAFDRLVRTHRAPLERYARSLGATREDAEEIAATALMRAYRNPRAVRREQEWRAWLSTVAQNLWIDARRPRQMRLVTGDGILDAVPVAGSVDDVAARADAARQICAAIALLPPAQRAAIYLREVRGHSYEEIADELGITLTAVTATLHRARAGVRRRCVGIAHALAGVALSPINLLRRGAVVTRLATASSTAAHLALPVVLVAGAGGGAIAGEHAMRAGAHPAAVQPATMMHGGDGTSAATRSRRVAIPRPSTGRRPAPRAVVAMGVLPGARFSGAPLPQASQSMATTTVTVRVPGAIPAGNPAGAPDATPAKPDNPAKPDKPAKPHKPAKPDKPDKPAKPDRAANPDKPAKPDKPARHVQGRGSPTPPAAASNHLSEIPASPPPGAAHATYGRAVELPASASAPAATRSAETAGAVPADASAAGPPAEVPAAIALGSSDPPGPEYERSSAPVAGEPQVPAQAPGDGPS